MNLMRKLLVGHQGRGDSAAAAEEGPQSSQHTALGLMHLHKLFAELTHPAHPLTQQEQEQRLYNMLPLFCKVRRAHFRHAKHYVRHTHSNAGVVAVRQAVLNV